MGVVLLFLVHWVVWGLGLFFMWTPHQRHHLHIVSHVQFAAFLVCECLGFPLQRCSIGWKPLVFFCFLFPLVEETHFLLPTSNVKEPWCDGAFGTCLFEGVSKFPCGSSGKESTCNTGDLGLSPGLGGSPEEVKGYPLQYSGLENFMESQTVGQDSAIFTFTFSPKWKCESRSTRFGNQTLHFYIILNFSNSGGEKKRSCFKI